MGLTARSFSREIDTLLACAGRINVADQVNEMVLQNQLDTESVAAVVYEVLVNHWNYAALSVNLKNSTSDSTAIFSEISKWKAMDIVLLFHHPDLGSILINPKNPAHKEYLADLRKNELIVIYAGYEGKKDADALCETACEKCADLLDGKKVKVTPAFAKGSYTFKKAKAAAPKAASAKAPKASAPKATKTAAKPAPQARASGSSFSFGSADSDVVAQKPQAQQASPVSLRKMSPMISVPVTNELFHNGNVEAWKKIIASYQNKYPTLAIFVYYDGERITDINSLFKWGKVKHGSCIQFVVAGDNIQDVAKLKKYFAQGASPMFEAFLRGAPGQILNLF